MSLTIQLPSLYPKQRAAFYNPARTAVCEASTKAGKSVGALTWIIDGAINDPEPGSSLWTEPVYPLAEVMYHRTKRWFTQVDPQQAYWKGNDSKLILNVPNGGQVFFRGADRPDTIYGPDYKRAVMDEFTRSKEEAYHAVESTLTATGGPLRLIGNVKGRGNWGYRMARLAQSGAPNMAYSKITCYDAVDAGVLDIEVIEDAKRKLPEHVFRELYLAEPSDDGGNPFGLQHIAACVSDAGLGNGTPVAFGVDLAKSVDWTVVVALDGTGRVVRHERWQHEPWDRTEARILDLVGHSPTLVDSTGVGDPIVERLQRNAPNIDGLKFTQQSKQQLMEGLAAAIQSHTISFPDGVIRQELETFEYEHTRTGVRYTAPEGLHDDCVCALALAVAKWQQHRPVGVTVVTNAKPVVIDTRPATEIWAERRKDHNYGFAPLGGRGRGRW